MPQVVSGGTSASGVVPLGQSTKIPQFFVDKGELTSHIKAAHSDFEFKNFEGCTNQCIDAAKLAAKYVTTPIQYNFSKYVAKPSAPTFAQVQPEIANVKKLSKYAISEIDFSNMQGCLTWVAQMHAIAQKF